MLTEHTVPRGHQRHPIGWDDFLMREKPTRRDLGCVPAYVHAYADTGSALSGLKLVA